MQRRAQCAPSLGACGSSYARGVWLNHALCHDLWDRQILAENSQESVQSVPLLRGCAVNAADEKCPAGSLREPPTGADPLPAALVGSGKALRVFAATQRGTELPVASAPTVGVPVNSELSDRVLGSGAVGNLSELWDFRESHGVCGAAASGSSVKWLHAADILYFLLSPSRPV